MKNLPVVLVATPTEGIQVAKEKLYSLVDDKTLLFPSGGNTPRPLYEQLAKDQQFQTGSIALVDERYGKPFHERSNAKLLKDVGITDFHPILDENKSLEETARLYDHKVNDLFSQYPKRVAIMGVGSDGHIASVPAGERLKIQDSRFKNENLVTSVHDFPGEFRERISLTFKALSMMGMLIVIVFGKEKKEALEKMLEEDPPAGGEEEIPARFYMRPEIVGKTLLITDQKI